MITALIRVITDGGRVEEVGRGERGRGEEGGGGWGEGPERSRPSEPPDPSQSSK